MKKIKRILAVFLAICLLAAGGCRESAAEEETTEYSMYYLALSETKLETVPYEPSEENAETMIDEIYQMFSQPSDSEEYLKLLPEDVLMKNYTFEGQTVTLNFDEEYKKMNNAREILVRTGMVLAFTQIPGVTYVEFLENQKRFHSVKDVQPLSSVAIQASRELYPETKETFESIPMNTDGVQKEKSTDVLKLAWDRSTILMNHLQEEMEKSGVMAAYGVDRDELRVYCSSYMGNAQFDYSVRELKNVAEESRAMNDMDEALL